MPPAKPAEPQSPCPCGSQKKLQDCCLSYLQHKARPATAEALMRSRYTAYALLDIDYLWDTWSAKARTRSSKEEIRQWAESCEWLGLQILATEAGGEQDTQGLVTFAARFRCNGQVQQHHEVSLFEKTAEGWRYIDHQG